ncbi:MAG: hypothetical protein D3906_08010 [Candidatus Electrothrix sp. AUS1_2]|nr:hypothetical protein [Candidatus Electrothrix sp. AUS1_2]
MIKPDDQSIADNFHYSTKKAQQKQKAADFPVEELPISAAPGRYISNTWFRSDQMGAFVSINSMLAVRLSACSDMLRLRGFVCRRTNETGVRALPDLSALFFVFAMLIDYSMVREKTLIPIRVNSMGSPHLFTPLGYGYRL